MKNLPVRCGDPTLVFMAATLAFAGIGKASTAACTTTGNGSTLASYGLPSLANGCWETDQTFSDFNVTNSSGPFAPVQSTSTDNIVGSTTFSNVSTPWTVGATFEGNTPWELTGSLGRHLAGTVDMLVNSSQAYFAVGGYPTPPLGDSLYIQNVSLATVGSTGDASSIGDSMSVTEIVCIGTAACTSSDEVTLTATYGNASNAPVYSCTAGASANATCGTLLTSSTPILATFTVNANTLNVSDSYNLTVRNNTTDTLSSFLNNFGEFEFEPTEFAPEPSTFLLLGTAMAALIVLRLRRRKV
jgi:hypothetical protein